MYRYLLKRLFLLPITLFFIILINFIIINFAPGDPVEVMDIGSSGDALQQVSSGSSSNLDDRYMQFREHYGLTLPVLFNTWPWTSYQRVLKDLDLIVDFERKIQNKLSFSEYRELSTFFGDRSKYTLKHLVKIMNTEKLPWSMRSRAADFFIRGAFKQAVVKASLTPVQRKFNLEVSRNNTFLLEQKIVNNDGEVDWIRKIGALTIWYKAIKEKRLYEPTFMQSLKIFFFQSRFVRYFYRIISLDFGSLRNDSNKSVISEVSKRFKYSLTLAIIPMFISFSLSLIFGALMAQYHGQLLDLFLNIGCLLLYATPVFVVGPFLIEYMGLNGHFPWTSTPIPYSGFQSVAEKYDSLTSFWRIIDIAKHLFLPFIAILYSSFSANARLSRNAFLEVSRQDFVKMAYAKGLSRRIVLTKHIGRNAAITLVTAIAGSLGVVMGGSLIIETLFEINGFGKFFYDAVINRDYNVIMFSTLAGSFLTLVGYVVADISYMLLDPRVIME